LVAPSWGPALPRCSAEKKELPVHLWLRTVEYSPTASQDGIWIEKAPKTMLLKGIFYGKVA